MPIYWQGDMPRGDFRFFLSDFWIDGVNRAPLNRRAWVVQERFLARRNLHFGSGSLFFGCHEMEACEAFPGGLPELFQTLIANGFKGVVPFNDEGVSDGKETFLRSWQKIATAFMSSKLTFASDKMITLSGVADEFRNINNNIYVAGLFDNGYLVHQLMWQSTGRRPETGPSARSAYRAPS